MQAFRARRAVLRGSGHSRISPARGPKAPPRPGTCDGAGACTQPSTSCGAYACDTSACRAAFATGASASPSARTCGVSTQVSSLEVGTAEVISGLARFHKSCEPCLQLASYGHLTGPDHHAPQWCAAVVATGGCRFHMKYGISGKRQTTSF